VAFATVLRFPQQVAPKAKSPSPPIFTSTQKSLSLFRKTIHVLEKTIINARDRNLLLMTG
jgi:hypothetical protein